MKLKEFLQTSGLKSKFVAQELGITEQHMTNIVTGRKEPSLVLACKIEEYTKGKVKPKDFLPPKGEGKARPGRGKARKAGRASAEDSTSEP